MVCNLSHLSLALFSSSWPFGKYVDDTDLLLRADLPECLEEDFFAKIQRAVWYWARIVMVTGGSLMPVQCHASIITFKYV